MILLARSFGGAGLANKRGALAAAIWAAATLARDDDLQGCLYLLVSTAGETGRHLAAEALMDELGTVPDIGVVAVGTGNRIALGNKGRIDVDIQVLGRASHSSTPWQGVNAIEGALQIMNELAALPLPVEAHPALGRVSLTPTSIRSWPEATHTVQDEVRMTYDRRLLPGEDATSAFEEIRNVVANMTPWSVVVERGPWMLPSEVASDALVVQRIQERLRQIGCPPPEMVFSHGALDAGYLNALGCETVMWGPGDVDKRHTDDERVPVEQLESSNTKRCLCPCKP